VKPRRNSSLSPLVSPRTAGIYLKSDERILGESGFVEQILAAVGEEMERKARYGHQGLDLEKLAKIAADVLEVDSICVEAPGKQPEGSGRGLSSATGPSENSGPRRQQSSGVLA